MDKLGKQADLMSMQCLLLLYAIYKFTTDLFFFGQKKCVMFWSNKDTILSYATKAAVFL